jgi:rhamnose utilization protein RhaD (predicted bifunctional aldolase and dehydrogenase)
MKEVLGNEALWIPSTNPGYILSKTVKDALETYQSRTNSFPSYILLQNHGVFIGADTVQGIDELYRKLMESLTKNIKRFPDFSENRDSFGPSRALGAELMKLAYGQTAAAAGAKGVGAKEAAAEGTVLFCRNREIELRTATHTAFEAVSSAYTPDHIVYSGSDPLFVDAGEYPQSMPDANLQQALTRLGEAWSRHAQRHGRQPKIVAVRGVGVFGLCAGKKAAELAILLFLDTLKVACYTESFGGGRFMSQDQIDFINTWEVEQYRSKIATDK